ncbi:MAG TPA: hypothetical protein VFB59_02440 [Candidatus Saccharimonadales bacterium]|nr:hypothetical protein [Candidatus Saccharimonadales bacterium]
MAQKNAHNASPRFITIIGIVLVLAFVFFSWWRYSAEVALDAHPDLSYVQYANQYFGWVLQSQAAFGALLFLGGVTGLIILKERKFLMYLNCLLLAGAVVGSVIVAESFNATPNGKPSSYISLNCGRGTQLVWSHDLPAQGFPCTATAQNYGWPQPVMTTYTDVRGSSAPVNYFEYPDRQDIGIGGRFSKDSTYINFFIITAVQMIWFIGITHLPFTKFNAWRKKREGVTTCIVATGALVVALLFGLVGVIING